MRHLPMPGEEGIPGGDDHFICGVAASATVLVSVVAAALLYAVVLAKRTMSRRSER